MPIYEYHCEDCGTEFEALVRGEEKPGCPSCGRQRLSRRMSVPAAHTAGKNQPPCPARDSCGMASPCCGLDCGMQ